MKDRCLHEKRNDTSKRFAKSSKTIALQIMFLQLQTTINFGQNHQFLKLMILQDAFLPETMDQYKMHYSKRPTILGDF